MRAHALLQRLLGELQSFVYFNNGRYYAGVREDADVTEAVAGIIREVEIFLALDQTPDLC